MSLLQGINKLNAETEGSTEAINFQVNSSFPKEISALFQKVLDRSESLGVTTTTKDAEIKHTELLNMLRNEINPQIAKVIEKYTNFKVREITSNHSQSVNDVCSFYMMIDESSINFEKILEAISLSEGTLYDKDIKILTDISAMSKSMDRVTGKIMSGSMLVIDINIPLSGFVIADYTGKPELQLTADELTAIIFHEIGHIFSFVEYMGDASYLGYYGNNILRNITREFEKDPNKVMTDVANAAEKNISKVDNPIHKQLLKKGAMLLKKTADSEIIDKTNGDTNYSGGIMAIIISVIEAITSIMFTLIWNSIILGILLAMPDRAIMRTGGKEQYLSREYTTTKNDSQYERLADEFVSRYQLSKHINSGLDKIIDVYKLIGSGGMFVIYDKVIRDFLVTKIIFQIISIPSTVVNFIGKLRINGVDATYEDDLKRFRRNISNMHDLLKDLKLSSAVRQSIVEDIEEMELFLAKSKHKYNLNMIEKIARFIISSPSNLVFGTGGYVFGNANLDKEYKTLLDEIDNLLSNKSFYHAEKIKQVLG